MFADNRIFRVPCLHGFSSFEQSASCYVPLWWAAFWQFSPPIVPLVVGIAVHECCTVTGRLSLSALSLSLIAGAVLSLTRSWRCGVAIVAGSTLIATRLLCRCSADTQQVLTLLGMVFLGMACTGTLAMMHLALHADSAGITAELTVLGILSYHESLLSEATTAALACALSAFVVGTSPGQTERRGRAHTGGSYPSGPDSFRRVPENAPYRVLRCVVIVARFHAATSMWSSAPKLPGPARLQEAMPVCLREGLLDTPDHIEDLCSFRTHSQFIFWEAQDSGPSPRRKRSVS